MSDRPQAPGPDDNRPTATPDPAAVAAELAKADRTLADLQQPDEIATAAEAIFQAEEAVDELKRQLARDRSFITRSIILVFAASVMLAILFAMVPPLVGLFRDVSESNWDWAKAAGFLKEILTNIVLPVVTLVIGFYFGSEKR